MTAKKKIEKKATREPGEEEAEWENLAPEKFEFESKGDTIQGILLDAKEMSLGGLSYTVQTRDGIRYFFGGRQIDGILPTKVGYEIKVKYLGMEHTAKGYRVKTFDVKFRRAQIEPPTDPDVPF